MSNRDRAIDAYQRHGTITGAARELGLNRDTIRHHIKKAGLYDTKPLFAGRLHEREVFSRPKPKKGGVKRYIVTSAQNNTSVNQPVWDNLIALAEHYDAEILVGTFTYNKDAFAAQFAKKNTRQVSDDEDLWYDQQVKPYIVDAPVEIAPGLVWCGEMNILPTASRPLQGLEVYTGQKSGIFPHVKVHMQSVASGKFEPTKFNYSTGTVTKRNYIQKKAGLKAEFHHVYGGLLVEVDGDGDWFVRQLNADSHGVIYDLNLKVRNGKVTDGHRTRAVTWGDVHVAAIDQDTAEMSWGDGGILDVLKPEYQFMHDVLDFRARNGHTFKRNLIHERFAAYVQGHDSVEKEISDVATFLDQSAREWCETVIVHSNHHDFFVEWLRIGDYKSDPINAIYFLEAQLHMFRAIAAAPAVPPNMFRWAIERVNGETNRTLFLDEDESFVLNGIEYGMHGHLGPNGARGTAGNQARMGRKMNRGHEHSASIFEGVFTAGVKGSLDQGYNRGPSSWSHSDIVTYPNGKRAILTTTNGKWRAA